MDKITLNNEIILCRAAVRKARVAVIRKLIKKIKILKSCKKEGFKEKKLQKSERLFKKVQIMKNAKDDEVTRFALRNPDLEKYIRGSKIDVRQNALARLAKHNAVLKKVKAIKEKIPNWEVELPLLLNSMTKKNKKLKELGNREGEKKEGDRSKKKLSNVPKQKKLEGQKEKTVKQKQVIQDEEVFEAPKIEKINDPFFMGKMMIVPKLLDNSKESKNKNGMEKDRFREKEKGSGSSLFNAKPFKAKKDSISNHKFQKYVPETEEKLHPSWAAKKIKLIKPFEGKKIKFSDE